MTAVLCIGSVLWDVIGRSASVMRQGSDVPGRITQIPGGVALNIAMTLVRFGLRPALLSAVGRDVLGDVLVSECRDMGLETGFLYRSEDLPTDRYMAVEGANGLIAAIADAHSLEAAGDKILRPLQDGRLGSKAAPFEGLIALDGNLTEHLLAQIARDPAFSAADLRVAPASPGKAERLLPFLSRSFDSTGAVLYVNCEEAGILCQTEFADAETAAQALVARGALRALVTDGGALCADADGAGVVSERPPEVLVTRVTGAGDTFMAAHMAAELAGQDRAAALKSALTAAARYVSGETPHD
ncbi:PfkB family carbohydrate kinase [Primorskyibacter aestuariivivens]|uniref:PfkB family carbohydrate kinase n=1 Tax=Primorskyibacter aestuariivivens TaxID=1888912 RepID=UPI0023017640|nr:PfkB family carbohydrate kinase [Primorskyibacter aestuariivivens]MDA7428906.1 PfkB family carbohydrate kinase [Primorskyibacter aestuariivivens]